LELFLYLFRKYWHILEIGFYYFGWFSFKYGSNQWDKKIKLNKINPKENVGVWRPIITRWRISDIILFIYLVILFCLDFPILPYILLFYWHFVLRPLYFMFLEKKNLAPDCYKLFNYKLINYLINNIINYINILLYIIFEYNIIFRKKI